MSETEELAKAIQESAKLGEKSLDIAEKAGSFFAKVFKDPINEISGMITDKLRFIKNDAEDHGRKPVDESVSYF